jgi:hypothetical protein
LERRQGIGALDVPTEGEEGEPGQNGGAPGVGVPLAVLSDGELPLLSDRRRVRVRCLPRVRVPDLLTREVGVFAGVAVAGNPIRRRRRRWQVLRLIGVLVVISHGGYSWFSGVLR